MSILLRAWQRCLAVFKKNALDADFDEEAAAHIALAIDDYVRRGMSLSEAQRLARLRTCGCRSSECALYSGGLHRR